MRRLTLALAAPLLAATLLSAPAAHAATVHRATVKQARHALLGQSVLYPQRHARATITGWHAYTRHKWGTRWYPQITVTRLPDNCLRCPQTAGHPHYVYRDTPRGWRLVSGPAGFTAMRSGHPWWQFWHWNWGDILGWVWHHLLLQCVEGAAAGVVGKAGHTLAVKIITRGAQLVRLGGAEGYAALALGGCLANLVLGNLPNTLRTRGT